ncbi:hypothetical protein [Klebsiella variicola]|uniref:hypothetical protein n=1 Tax=Klebsiella variicola TaxID=244366 RepID=UPI003CFF9B10
MKQKQPLHYVHFQCNHVTGFVEVEPNGAMWVIFAGQRMAYSTMQGKLKQVVHSVMVQFNMVSAWRN